MTNSSQRLIRRAGTLPKLPELRTPEGVRVRVQLFPTDATLAADVARTWASLVPDRVDDATFRADLEEHLRRWYPNLSLQGQSELAAMTQEEEVWYLFRDGRIRRESPVRDRFYGVMSSARSTRDEVLSTMRQAELAAQTFGQRRTRTPGETTPAESPGEGTPTASPTTSGA
jgi:hypothetical protein